MDTDVLIVGGGVGGAVLALALGHRTHGVTILEREMHAHASSRPEVLQAPTFAALDAMGIGDRLRSEASIPLEGFDVQQGDRTIASIGRDDLRRAGVAPRSADPDLLRALILDAAVSTGLVTLRRGAEVNGIVLENGRAVGVRGTEGGRAFELRAALVVGDDGRRSAVRDGLGIPISLRPFPVEIVTVRFRRPAALPGARARIWIASRGDGPFAAGLIPVPAGDSVMVMPCRVGMWDRVAHEPDRFWTTLSQLTPLAPSIREAVRFPDDFAHFILSFGHAARYSAGGAVLIGDAAHPMSPAGGQGANAAIADALALANIVDAAFGSGKITDNDLVEFERRRRMANARSLSFSQRGANIIRWSRWIPGSSLALTALVRLADRRDGVKQRLLRQVATAFLERPNDV